MRREKRHKHAILVSIAAICILEVCYLYRVHRYVLLDLNNIVEHAQLQSQQHSHPTFKVFEDEELQTWFDSLELGWESQPAQWLQDLCPEVVEHFTRFPSFKELDPEKLKGMPFLPTDHAAQVVSNLIYSFY
jgi:hypothetical protein